MSTSASVRGIIVKKVRYKESDLIVTVLSQKGERLSFLARGALKSKKRFGGGILEPTHYIQVEYKKSSTHTDALGVISEAQLLEDFKGLRTDYDRLDFALRLLDVVYRVSLEGDEDSANLYNLLGNTLRFAQTCASVHVLKAGFYLKFFHQQGVLKVDEWMKPFLVQPISELATFAMPPGLEFELESLQKQVESYIQSPDAFDFSLSRG